MKNIITWIKAIVLWILIPKNRLVAIKYIKMGLDLSAKVTKITKSKKDDIGVAYVAMQFDKATELLSSNEIETISHAITKDKGLLKDLKIGYSVKEKKVKAKVGIFSAEYNPSSKGVDFGITF